VPVEAHIKEHPAWFHRFDVSWTPTVLIMDSGGTERYRIEGYLPRPEFLTEVQFGLARLAFKHKKWSDAETKYGEIAEHHPDSAVAAEAQYWTGVSQYQRTHDPAILTETGKRLAEKYPSSIWTKKGSVWVA
jgi:TolA-binding protein